MGQVLEPARSSSLRVDYGKKNFDAPLNLSLETDSFLVEEVPYLAQSNESSEDDRCSNQYYKSLKNNDVVRSLVFRSRSLRQQIGTGALLSVRAFWILPAVKRALTLHQQMPFDLIVSTYGPPASHIIAGILKKRLPSLFWVADYRDLWNDYDFETRRWPFSTVENWLENFFVRPSDLLTTVSDPLANILYNRFGKPTVTIENGFDLSDIQSRQHGYFPDDGKVRLVYTGRLHSEKRNPRPFLKAVQQLIRQGKISDSNLEVLFYSNEFGSLAEFIDNWGLNGVVKIAGFVDRKTALSVQCSADALIFVDWSDASIDGILTGKIFEYLYSGRPILGIGSDETRAAGRLLIESGTGVCLGNSVDSIAATILKLVQKQPLDYFPNKNILEKYTREGLARKMLNIALKHMEETSRI